MTDPLSSEPGLSVFYEHPSRALREADVRVAAARLEAGERVRLREVNVVLAGRELVHEINRTWLGHDWPTDVVSFPLDAEAQADGVIDGEVYVDLDMAAERAEEFGATPEGEALRYVVHGLLHLCGHDDATDDERAAMRALEDRYLASAA